MAIKLKQDKKKKKVPKKTKIFSLIVFLVFFAIATIYLLSFLYRSSLEDDYNEMMEFYSQKEAEAQSLRRQVDRVAVEEDTKIRFLKDIIERRRKTTDFFSLLEELTHPRLYFNSMSLDVIEGEARIEGVAENFRVLGEQVQYLREKSAIFEGEANDLIRVIARGGEESLDQYTLEFFISEGNLEIYIMDEKTGREVLELERDNQRPKAQAIKEERMVILPLEGETEISQEFLELVSLSVSEEMSASVYFYLLEGEKIEEMNNTFLILEKNPLIEKVEVVEMRVREDEEEIDVVILEEEEETNEEEDNNNDEEEELDEEELIKRGEVNFSLRLYLNPRMFGVSY